VNAEADELLPCVELGATQDALASVVWLHGLGADGHDFVPIVPHLGVPESWRVRFVFPHAPSMPVSLNAGMVMPAWYDIAEANLDRRHDEAGIAASHGRIESLLAREVSRGVPPERIVLAGFSQGGAMALHVGLRHAERLAGIVALSCYMLRGESLQAEAAPANAATPVFMGHGSRDPMVPMSRGEAARDQLLAAGRPVQWHAYPMQHEVCAEQIADLAAWLAPRLGPSAGLRGG